MLTAFCLGALLGFLVRGLMAIETVRQRDRLLAEVRRMQREQLRGVGWLC